jgi:hypothetical protein
MDDGAAKNLAYAVSMRDRDPRRAAASVFVRRNGTFAFGGTCFAFRRANHVLTAGHCVEGLGPEDVEIAFPDAAQRATAADLVRHPTADLALVRLASGVPHEGVEPFAVHGRIARGERFAGFGSVAGTREHFAGRIRRVFSDEDDGHRYAEMSIAARDGFSGGPLFSPGPPFALVGVMTANRSTPLALALARSRALQRLQPAARSGHGVALLVGDLSDWLDEHAPEQQRET